MSLFWRTTRIELARETVVGARGTKRVRGLELRAADGATRRLDGALVAVATLPSPASELPRQHGAAVAFEAARGGFATVVDARGATTVPDVFACGDVTGYAGPEAAARDGAKVGRALAATLAMLVALAILPILPSGCATSSTPPPAGESPPSANVPTLPPGVIEPPPFAAPPPATPETAADARTQLRRAILDAAWTTVRDKHYDKTLGGLDWKAVRARYEPLALGAPSEAAFYRVLNQMIGELGQSHMMITGPGAEDEVAADETAKPGDMPSDVPSSAPSNAPAEQSTAVVGGPIGDPGLTVRIIEGRPTITRVRAGSSAEKVGLAPGYVVTQIAGRPLKAPHNSTRPLRPVEERFELRRAAALRLAGPVGTRVTVSYLDDRDRPGKAVLVRDPPRGQAVQIGFLPPIYPEVRAYEIGDVGVIAFSVFFLDPVLGDIKKAVARFQEHHVRAIVLDIRGNPGGQGAMSIPVASLFVDQPVHLGTLTFRDMGQKFDARPELGAKPFLGPLAILT
ncbi:MAG TPA: S41 family peptidase, partial [Polyangia bacterium]|nr:S41 family peptidase [Polyangia bacterium]